MTRRRIMSATWQLVAFPLIVPWRAEFWSLPLFFPDLAVGVLRQWPKGLPYRGRPLPPEAAAGGKELQHYAPGELTQWQAYDKYAGDREEVGDIVRALRGEPAEAEPAAGPWKDEDAWRVAWQLEVMEADQEADLIRVDREKPGWERPWPRKPGRSRRTLPYHRGTRRFWTRKPPGCGMFCGVGR
jgi:hypothetical protein